MARGTATFAQQSADQTRVRDLQQMLHAQCEFVIQQAEIVATQSKILAQSVAQEVSEPIERHERRDLSATNPLPSLRATLEAKFGRSLSVMLPLRTRRRQPIKPLGPLGIERCGMFATGPQQADQPPLSSAA